MNLVPGYLETIMVGQEIVKIAVVPLQVLQISIDTFLGKMLEIHHF
jgi:hypothetical protein